jgi:hypothetical protein
MGRVIIEKLRFVRKWRMEAYIIIEFNAQREGTVFCLALE